MKRTNQYYVEIESINQSINRLTPTTHVTLLAKDSYFFPFQRYSRSQKNKKTKNSQFHLPDGSVSVGIFVSSTNFRPPMSPNRVICHAFITDCTCCFSLPRLFCFPSSFDKSVRDSVPRFSFPVSGESSLETVSFGRRIPAAVILASTADGADGEMVSDFAIVVETFSSFLCASDSDFVTVFRGNSDLGMSACVRRHRAWEGSWSDRSVLNSWHVLVISCSIPQNRSSKNYKWWWVEKKYSEELIFSLYYYQSINSTMHHVENMKITWEDSTVVSVCCFKARVDSAICTFLTLHSRQVFSHKIPNPRRSFDG